MRSSAKPKRVARRTPRTQPQQSPSMAIARVVAREQGGARVRVGAEERFAAVDGAVDPALLDEAARTGAPVVLDEQGVVVGVLAVRRTLALEPDGALEATLPRIRLQAEEVILKTRAALVHLRGNELELHATNLLCRAREVAKILGRALKLN